MPISLPRLFRAIVLLALALHVFCMYSIARGMQGGAGFDVGAMVLAAAFAFAMLVPLVWAVALPEMPEMYTRHVRARRWFNQGRCSACGYQVTASESWRCTECGAERTPPEPYAVKPRTIRLFIAMNLLAWGLGVAMGETWALQDERAFASEAAAHVQSGAKEPYSRPRWWPSDAMTLRDD